MKHSEDWLNHFLSNSRISRVNWNQLPRISSSERAMLLKGIQAWQLGETSDGAHLLKAAVKYSRSINDPIYPSVIQLFIKEEQKHGHHLGLYLDLINEDRLSHDWGDSMFRLVRYFLNNMEIWTVAVLVVESVAQLFYQSLKEATNCPLLKEICTDILIDEAYHIQFQWERLMIIYSGKSAFIKRMSSIAYRLFFSVVVRVVWIAHRSVFIAGGLSYSSYLEKMRLKYNKTFRRLKMNKLPEFTVW